MTLDAVFEEARRRGFVLCNFFQLENGRFRCNWIVEGHGQKFGEHANPYLAASIALANAIEAAEEDLIG